MIPKLAIRWIPTVFALGLLAGLIAGCSLLQQMTQIQKPKVDVAGVRMTRLDLDGIDLALDLSIANPNLLEINLAGFDYELLFDASSFLKGNQTKPIAIPAQGTGHVEIPVSLTFQQIYQTYQSFKNSDTTDYTIQAGLTFDLPVIGPYRIPVQTSGRLPLVKIPKISVSRLKIARMGFTSADLELDVAVDNPNAFSFLINAFDYDFAVNGSRWAQGKSVKGTTIQKKGKSEIAIPVSLDFLKIGQTAVGLLKGKSDLDYRLDGGLDLKSSVSLIGNVQMPINLSGSVPITK